MSEKSQPLWGSDEIIINYNLSVMVMFDLPFLLSCCTIVSYLDSSRFLDQSQTEYCCNAMGRIFET